MKYDGRPLAPNVFTLGWHKGKDGLWYGSKNQPRAGSRARFAQPKRDAKFHPDVKRNPPRTLIYSSVVEIVASKAGMDHHCDASCKRARHVYRHKFSASARIYGLPGGSLLIE